MSKYYESHKKWIRENPERYKEICNRSHYKAKKEVMEAYSGSPAYCVCCGENQLIFLTIDHIKNNGAKHRKDSGIRGGNGFYQWLRKNKYPPGYQVLCFNCNWAKSHGGCPHQII